MSEIFLYVALLVAFLNSAAIILQCLARKRLLSLLQEITRKVIQIRAFHLQFEREVSALVAALQAHEQEMAHNRVVATYYEQAIGRIRAELARQSVKVEQIKQSLEVLRN